MASEAATAVPPSSSPPSHYGPNYVGKIPKATLYAQESDPWSSAVLLALDEKGYGSDEFDLRLVNTAKGDNYDPAYLRINGAGAVPTLVVPMDRFLIPEMECRYKAVSEISKILEFVDKSRTVVSRTHTTSHAPAPALAPATVDGLSKSNVIIDQVHSAPMDPEFFYLSARTPEELAQKSKGPQLSYINDRCKRLEGALAPAAESPDPNDPAPALTTRSRGFLEAQHTVYKNYLEVYNSSENPEAEVVKEFIAKSKQSWEVELKAALELIEATIKSSHVAAGEESLQDNHSDAVGSRGPASTRPVPIAGQPQDAEPAKAVGLILGEQISLVDLHLFPWLARLVSLCGGNLDADGLKALASNVGSSLPDRVQAFWQAMLERESVKKVYKGQIH